VTQSNCIPEVVFESITSLDPGRIVLLGGLPALSAAVEDLTVCP
jgi:hypothetical protein